jgi:N-acyl-L-homoserine lactone synthetase
MDECMKYKKFLDDLTPTHWIEEQTKIAKEKVFRKREEIYKEKYRQWEVSREETMQQLDEDNAKKSFQIQPPKLEEIVIECGVETNFLFDRMQTHRICY